MGTDIQERIRHRAYEIWESEGRPEHQADRHWYQASSEVGGSGENDRDDRDEAALLQGAGERGDFDFNHRKPSTPGKAGAVVITTGEEPLHQTVKKTEGP